MASGQSPKVPVGVLFPGQASQQAGMGLALCEASESARDTYAIADRVTGLPISELCCNGTLAELTRTDVAQLAVVTTSLAAAAALEEQLGFPPSAVAAAGHSVGELAAMGWAGALSVEDTLTLVRERGRLMERNSTATLGAMVAVFGLTPPQLEAVCNAAAEETGASVQMANFNAPDQIVISGARQAVEIATRLATGAGAQRVVPLNVGGPFHSVYMTSAAQDFAAACREVSIRPPRLPIVLNTTAGPTIDPDALRQELSVQVTSPVRWSESMETLSRMGCETFVELGPGRVLSSLARRCLPAAQALSAGTPIALGEAARLWQIAP